MINKSSIRRKSKEVFQKVITLRKQGFSYTEIRKETGIAKSTINNWLTFAGLTLGNEHLQIQARKRLENHTLGTAASKITRAKRKDEDVQRSILATKNYFADPFFIAGIMLYEAEGSKGSSNGFSNSDFRLIVIYIKFLERYFSVKKNLNITYRLYIHENRRADLYRIKSFWVKKLLIDDSTLKISWKYNKVVKRRINLDYVGQLEVRIKGISHFTSKMLAISDIILNKYQRI